MSIQVVCPNGHPLTLDDASAGRIGLCPVCKAPVKVPQADSRPLSENAALDLPGTAKTETSPGKSLLPGGTVFGHAERGKPSVRRCSRCNREVIASLSACPHCGSELP